MAAIRYGNIPRALHLSTKSHKIPTMLVQSSKCLNCPGYIRKQNLASKAKASQLRTSTAVSPHITEDIRW